MYNVRMTKTKQCEYCHNDFQAKDYRNRFCNRSCAASFNNKKFVKRPGRVGPVECGFCHNILTSNQQKFCSRKCAGDEKTGAVLRRWIEDPSFGSNANGTLKGAIKRALLEQAEWKCWQCNWGEPNPILGRPILSIDHIDGNWKNNAWENLRVLCYNCHTLTPTFGILNKGSISGRRPNVPNRSL